MAPLFDNFTHREFPLFDQSTAHSGSFQRDVLAALSFIGVGVLAF